MSKEDLRIYLNDHLAGSVAALELIDHLTETFQGETLETFFVHLRDDIARDQETLEGLLKAIDEQASTVRRAGAWVAEKLSRLKIRLSDSEKDQLGLLNALEVLILGITGKRALWQALAASSESSPQVRGLDYAQLEQRAIEQLDRVNAKRLEVARTVFGDS